MAHKFLRDDGWFQFPAPGDITTTATATTTGFLTYLTNALTTNTTSLTTGTYATGPTISQGSSGVWYATTSMSWQLINGSQTLGAKLWDGTTIISEGMVSGPIGTFVSMNLAGVIASPAGNLKTSFVVYGGGGAGAITNISDLLGGSAGCTLTAIRIG